MRGHGITAGPSVQQATITAWRLNGLAELNYRAALLGTPNRFWPKILKRSVAEVGRAAEVWRTRGPTSCGAPRRRSNSRDTARGVDAGGTEKYRRPN